ncbi:MAG: hypothetical protein ACK41O_25810, partial [Runella zeae]
YDEELPIRYPQSPLLKASAERVFVSFEVGELLRNINPSPAVKAAQPVKETSSKNKSKKKK